MQTSSLAKWVECSPMVQETWVLSQVESYQRHKKWYLILPCLILSIKKYVSRVKGSNPGKGVAPSPTPRCSSYWKRSLLIAIFNMIKSCCLHGFHRLSLSSFVPIIHCFWQIIQITSGVHTESCLYEGVHKRTSVMSSSLLLQQCLMSCSSYLDGFTFNVRSIWR